MKAERLFRAIGLVDEDLIETAAETPVKKRPVWQRYAVAAACLMVLCGAGAAYLVTGGFRGHGASAGGSGINNAGSAADTAVFMSYAGPVLPLTTADKNPGVTAERHTDWNFTPRTDPEGYASQWGAAITDGYILSNPTDTDVTLTLLYPIVGGIKDLFSIDPGLTVNGETVGAELVIGDYAGGFGGAGGGEHAHVGLLLAVGAAQEDRYPSQWMDYQVLLDGGDYREAATGTQAPADIPITVYTFTDFEAPTEQYQAATQAVTFTVDDTRTTVLSYGFEGYSWDERTGEITYSYFVPDGQRRSKICKKLIVIGADLTGYTLQGYQDGGCDPGEEIDGVSCTVTRSETTLHEVLLELSREIFDTMEENPGYYGWLSEAAEILNPETYCLLAERALEQYGLLSDKPVDRYDSGRLDELMDEVLSVDRVLYLKTEVTVPTGGTAEVTARYWKAPSFDFACSGSDRRNLQGYDLMTTLDSTLAFTAQTASVTHVENVQITGQNFGFDPENGVTEVTLDLNQSHYYLEIQPIRKETD
mgnify:CR=1 FL=1